MDGFAPNYLTPAVISVRLPTHKDHRLSSTLQKEPPAMDAREISSAAALKVWHLPELLEVILLALPEYDILLVQCVSKLFQVSIQHSTRIRRKLFLEEDPSVPSASWGVDEKDQIVSLAHQSPQEKSKLTHIGERYIFNPLVFHEPDRERFTGLLDDLTPIPLFNTTETLHHFWFDDDGKEDLDSASCAGMFLTKPAITELRIDVHTVCRAPFAKSVIKNSSGIKLADVIREVKRAEEEHEETVRRCYVVMTYGCFVVSEARRWEVEDARIKEAV